MASHNTGKRSFDKLGPVETKRGASECGRSPEASPRRRIRWAEGDVTDVRYFKADACKAPVPPTMLLINEVIRAKQREESINSKLAISNRNRNPMACASFAPRPPPPSKAPEVTPADHAFEAKHSHDVERLRVSMVKYLEQHLRALAALDNIPQQNVEQNVALAAAFVERARHRLSRTWAEYCDVEAHCSLALVFHREVQWWLGCGTGADNGIMVSNPRTSGAVRPESLKHLEEEVRRNEAEQRRLQMILFQQQQKELLANNVGLPWSGSSQQHSTDSIGSVSIPLVPALE
mmetsp:Transcript_8119/g.29960  ORF Transcript_8119/g.29960 Transcript_8119/m.29960 type:complete len:291 (-) Transcript_8119:310-1182(-)